MGIAGEGSGQAVEDDEVECLLANQIYKVRIPCLQRWALLHISAGLIQCRGYLVT